MRFMGCHSGILGRQSDVLNHPKTRCILWGYMVGQLKGDPGTVQEDDSKRIFGESAGELIIRQWDFPWDFNWMSMGYHYGILMGC